MSSAPPIKFRCFHCNKLLGVSRTKAASVVACPQCGTELIVPSPSETAADSPSAEPDAPPRPSPSSSRIEPAVVLWDAPPPVEAAPPPEPAFLSLQLEPVSLRPDPPARTRGSSRSTAVGPGAPQSSAPAPPPPRPVGPEPASLPPFEPEPISIRDEVSPRLGSSSGSTREITARRNDVVLPRTVVVLWSLLVLLALVFSFAAGLLAGRFLWAPGVKVAMPITRTAPA